MVDLMNPGNVLPQLPMLGIQSDIKLSDIFSSSQYPY